MEAKRIASVVLFLLPLCVVHKAEAECTLSALVVSRNATGLSIHGQPEYAVAVRNTCICGQSRVKLACAGFATTEATDPDVLRADPDGERCTLNNDLPVFQGRDVEFKYAWSQQFSFAPLDSVISCS